MPQNLVRDRPDEAEMTDDPTWTWIGYESMQVAMARVVRSAGPKECANSAGLVGDNECQLSANTAAAFNIALH